MCLVPIALGTRTLTLRCQEKSSGEWTLPQTELQLLCLQIYRMNKVRSITSPSNVIKKSVLLKNNTGVHLVNCDATRSA